MGGLVPYDQPWRLGANEPTTLHLTAPVHIGEMSLDPGAYALYAIPGEDEWEVVVNSAVERWGIPINDEVRQHDVGSVTVTPETLSDDVEAMDIRLEPQDGGGAHLVVEWERTRLSVPVEAGSMEDEGGESKPIATLLAGDFFGEMAMLGKSVRSATVTTATDAVLYELRRDYLEPVLEVSPTMRQTLEAVSAERRRELQER